ncbi:MAG: glycosyltransferase family 2 protein [Candidatus Doudnabacteria bacterium]
MKDIKLAIATPLTYNSVPIQFFESYLSMIKPCRHIFIHSGGYQGLDVIRNNLIDGARNLNCTHILFLDIDHRHHPETITKLLSHKKPIVSGLSYMRNDPYEPCIFRGMINAYETITEWNYGELIEVDSVGAACLLVDMKVFKDIQKPYFQFLPNPDPMSRFGLGEDVVLCNKLKQAGYKIFVDTSCTNSHIGRVEVNKEFSAIWNGEKK